MNTNCELCADALIDETHVVAQVPQKGLMNICRDCRNGLGVDGWISLTYKDTGKTVTNLVW